MDKRMTLVGLDSSYMLNIITVHNCMVNAK